jgi:apolipoprotein N-acyltransferase
MYGRAYRTLYATLGGGLVHTGKKARKSSRNLVAVTPTGTADRFSYLWLAIAGGLYLFAAGRWAIPLAAWLAPLFLVRFVRTQHPRVGILLAWLVRSTVAEVALRGILPYPGPGYYVLVLLLIGLTMLPFLADRLIAPRLPGLPRPWSFPWPLPRLSTSALSAPTGLLPPSRTRSTVTCR